jgi:hypothetical protein
MRRELPRSVCFLLSFRTCDQHIPHRPIPTKIWTECGVTAYRMQCINQQNRVDLPEINVEILQPLRIGLRVKRLQVAVRIDNAATKRMVRNFHFKATVTSY